MTVALTRPSLEDRALAVFCDDLEAAIRTAGDQPTEPLSAVRTRCQSSLRTFIEEVWPVVDPQTPFVGNWHIDAICAHLEAVPMSPEWTPRASGDPGSAAALVDRCHRRAHRPVHPARYPGVHPV